MRRTATCRSVRYPRLPPCRLPGMCWTTLEASRVFDPRTGSLVEVPLPSDEIWNSHLKDHPPWIMPEQLSRSYVAGDGESGVVGGRKLCKLAGFDESGPRSGFLFAYQNPSTRSFGERPTWLSILVVERQCRKVSLTLGVFLFPFHPLFSSTISVVCLPLFLSMSWESKE